jgi:hypothetical protein
MKTTGRALLMLATIGVAGIGTAEAQKTMPHACALLPRADAEAVIGEPVGEPKKGPEAPASADVTTSQCMYATIDGQRSMSVLVRHSKKGDNSPGYVRKTMSDSGMKVTDVAGVGDTAFWAGVQLQAFKGANHQVVVTMMGIGRPQERAADAARKVLAKLQTS